MKHTRSQLVKDYVHIQEKVRGKADNSREHILKLLRPDVLRSTSWRPVILQQAEEFFKLVAAHDGRLLSIYDGSTEYQLGRWTLAKLGAASWPPTFACFFAFQTAEEALAARLPRSCRLSTAPRVLLRLCATGHAYHHASSDTWALSRVQTLEVITVPSTSSAAHQSPAQQPQLLLLDAPSSAHNAAQRSVPASITSDGDYHDPNRIAFTKLL